MNTKDRSIKEVTVKGMCDKPHVHIQFFIIPQLLTVFTRVLVDPVYKSTPNFRGQKLDFLISR